MNTKMYRYYTQKRKDLQKPSREKILPEKFSPTRGITSVFSFGVLGIPKALD